MAVSQQMIVTLEISQRFSGQLQGIAGVQCLGANRLNQAPNRILQHTGIDDTRFQCKLTGCFERIKTRFTGQ